MSLSFLVSVTQPILLGAVLPLFLGHSKVIATFASDPFRACPTSSPAQQQLVRVLAYSTVQALTLFVCVGPGPVLRVCCLLCFLRGGRATLTGGVACRLFSVCVLWFLFVVFSCLHYVNALIQIVSNYRK